MVDKNWRDAGKNRNLPKNKKLPKGKGKGKGKKGGGGGNPEVRALKEESRDVRKLTRREERSARTVYRRGVSDINQVHGQTGAFIASQNAAINKNYADTKNANSAAHASLKNQLAQNLGDSYSGVTNELSRLGINGAADLSGLHADSQNAANVADLQNSSNQSSLNLMSSGARDLGSLLGSMNSGSRMSAIGVNLNNRNDAINDIRQRRIDEQTQIRRMIRRLRTKK